MSFLRAETNDRFDRLAALLDQRFADVLRRALWGADGSQVPVGHVDLREEGPAKRAFLTDMLIRAEREETGKATGDLASTAVDSPSMQRALVEEAHGG